MKHTFRKLTAAVLSAVTLFGMQTVLPLQNIALTENALVASAAEFVPRFEAPSRDNRNYYEDNIFWQSDVGLPNCTCYAYGRAKELLGREPALSHGNANQWYGYNQNTGNYGYGSEPKLGAICCWSGGDYGHVAVVEAIDGDILTISQSSWGGEYFKTFTANKNSMNSISPGGFQGYIYIIDDGPDYPVPESKKDKNLQNGVYTFQNVGSGRFMNYAWGISNPNPMWIMDEDGSPEQTFSLTYVGDGKYTFTINHSDGGFVNCECPTENDIKNGTKLTGRTVYEDDTQRFRVTPVGDGKYIIQSGHTDQLVIGADSGNDRAQLRMQWYKKNNDLQRWRPVLLKTLPPDDTTEPPKTTTTVATTTAAPKTTATPKTTAVLKTTTVTTTTTTTTTTAKDAAMFCCGKVSVDAADLRSGEGDADLDLPGYQIKYPVSVKNSKKGFAAFGIQVYVPKDIGVKLKSEIEPYVIDNMRDTGMTSYVYNPNLSDDTNLIACGYIGQDMMKASTELFSVILTIPEDVKSGDKWTVEIKVMNVNDLNSEPLPFALQDGWIEITGKEPEPSAATFAKGIDVSVFQGDIDWKKVAESGVEFAVIRAATTNISNADFIKDVNFEQNYAGASAAGLKIGAYFYTSAVNQDEMRENIENLIPLLSGKQFDMPVYLDIERAERQTEIGKKKLTETVLYGCSLLKSAGFAAGVYANQNWLTNYLDANAIRSAGYEIWMAKWPSGSYAVDPAEYDCSQDCDVWQYSSLGEIAGISGNVDVDVRYAAFAEPAGLTGDVDCSGDVDVSDAVLLARLISEDPGAKITQRGLANGDCDGDGRRTTDDVIKILRIIARIK